MLEMDDFLPLIAGQECTVMLPCTPVRPMSEGYLRRIERDVENSKLYFDKRWRRPVDAFNAPKKEQTEVLGIPCSKEWHDVQVKMIHSGIEALSEMPEGWAQEAYQTLKQGKQNLERNVKMEENRDVLPCPFCGSSHWEHCFGGTLMCCECGAHGPSPVYVKRNSKNIPTLKDILEAADKSNGISLWNTRINPKSKTEYNSLARQITQVTNDLRDTLIRYSDFGTSAYLPGILCPDCAETTRIRMRMSDDIERLNTLLTEHNSDVKEDIRDTLKDLIVRGILWLMELEDTSEKVAR